MSRNQILLVFLLTCRAKLEDWQLFIGDRPEPWCASDYCMVPAGWTIEYPALIVMHDHPLDIRLIYNHSYDGTLQITLRHEQCEMTSYLNGNPISVLEPQDGIYTVQIAADPGDLALIELLTINCTLAITDLQWLIPIHVPIALYCGIAIGLLLLVGSAIAIAHSRRRALDTWPRNNEPTGECVASKPENVTPM